MTIFKETPNIFLLLFMVSLILFPRQNNALGAELKKRNDSQTSPALIFQDLKGNNFKLSNFRDKTVIVNFWASWCAPCVKEIPSLIKLSEDMKDYGVKLILINFGESKKRVRTFTKKQGWEHRFFLDENRESNDTWVKKGLPITYIIDKQGRIRYHALGELDWTDLAIKNTLAGLIK